MGLSKKNARKIYLQIFLTSLLILFLELILIRYLPAQISYLGYYSNFILLASFVGIGTGVLLADNWIDFEWYFPWILLILIPFTNILEISISPDSSGEVHFNSTFSLLILPEWIMVPAVFVLVTFVFITISQKLGRLLNKVPSLTAYTWDITGSLAGIILFTVLSYLQTSPFIWFCLIAIFSSYLLMEPSKKWLLICLVFLCICVVVYPSTFDHWSPYQRVAVKERHLDPDLRFYQIFANNIAHQQMLEVQILKKLIYNVPYTLFNNSNYKNVLIIGAGTGNDVATALAHNVSSIDAVEIDPVFVKLGTDLHPNKPYSDQRVHVTIDDARSFLEKTSKKYDLIVFALPDSLILASQHGNIRLESFLFTEESFFSARKHLTENGAIVLYNYYRTPWLVGKLTGMLDKTFGQKSYVITNSSDDHLSAIVNGNRLRDLKSNASLSATITDRPPPATDDWPFLYLKSPSFPMQYAIMLGALLIFIYFLLILAIKKPLHKVIQPTYFFLGAGFLLLETKSIIQFSLLFGSTWLTNALVFFAILLFVLFAIQIAQRFPLKNTTPLYILLGATLLIQYFFPMQALLVYDPILKYFVISLVTFLPVFLANIIFATTFKQSKNNARNFASNILGAAFGGVMEYFALLLGYHNLTLVVILCYFMAFVLFSLREYPIRRLVIRR